MKRGFCAKINFNSKIQLGLTHPVRRLRQSGHPAQAGRIAQIPSGQHGLLLGSIWATKVVQRWNGYFDMEILQTKACCMSCLLVFFGWAIISPIYAQKYPVSAIPDSIKANAHKMEEHTLNSSHVD